MIFENATKSSQLDQLIEQFESNWDESSWHALISKGSTYPWSHLQEIARIDVDLRYLKNLEANLTDYNLLEDSRYSSCLSDTPSDSLEWWGPILYEDYRSRSRTHLPCEASRWLRYVTTKPPAWLAGLIALERMDVSRSQDIRPNQKPLHCEWPEPGYLIGDFEIEELLGAGSFSRVFLAIQNSIGKRRVVLKFTSMPQQEPEWLGRFQHANIVPVYSVHKWNHLSVLCMPYCGRLTLADLLTRGITSTQIDLQGMMDTVRSIDLHRVDHVRRSSHYGNDGPASELLPNRESERDARLLQAPFPKSNPITLRLFQRLAAALHHAHSNGVIHGDIKPANILIRIDGEPALFDFNLSQAIDVQLTSVKGSLPYLAPEQLSGWADERPCMSASTDIYALGLVFFEFLTGRLPEIFRQPIATAGSGLRDAASQRSRFDWTREVASLPMGIQSILLKMLDGNMSARYATAGEIESDLNAELSNLPLLHAVEPFSNRMKKRIIKHRNPLSIATLASLVVCLLIAMVIGGYRWTNLAKRANATTVAKNFLADSQSSLAELYFARGSIDHTRLNQCFDIASQYDSLLFQGNSPASGWLDNEAKRDLDEAWTLHLLLTSFAIERDSELREITQQDRDKLNALTNFVGTSEQVRQFYRDCKQSIDREISSPPHVAGWTNTQIGFLGSMIYGELGDWKTSQTYLDLTETAPDEMGLYWFMRGRNQLMLGDADSSYVSFSLAINEKPKFVSAIVGRGFASIAKGQINSAIKDFDSAIKIQPEDANLYEYRSQAKSLAGDLQGALEDVEWILRRDSTRAAIRVVRYRLLIGLGRKSEADTEWSYVLGCEPTRANDYLVRAVERIGTQPKEAWEDLTRAGQLEPASTVVWQNKAYLASEINKDDATAIQCLDKVVELKPCNIEGLSGRAVLHARAGNVDLATQDIARALALANTNPGPTEYHAACVFAILAKHAPHYQEQANKYLARAMHHGYGLELIKNDTDLDNLRDSQAFREILQVSQLVIDSETSESKD